jgi:exodeoxyribonuclease VII small subunit
MSKPSASAKSAPPTSQEQEQEPASYELAVEELERLVQAMEAGQLPLDQLLASYQRGAALLNYCRARLQAVEQQVQVIEGGGAQAWGEE